MLVGLEEELDELADLQTLVSRRLNVGSQAEPRRGNAWYADAAPV